MKKGEKIYKLYPPPGMDWGLTPKVLLDTRDLISIVRNSEDNPLILTSQRFRELTDMMSHDYVSLLFDLLKSGILYQKLCFYRTIDAEEPYFEIMAYPSSLGVFSNV